MYAAARPWCVADESACFDEDCPKHGDTAELNERCLVCGSEEMLEITDDGPPEQSIRVCAECGSDEP